MREYWPEMTLIVVLCSLLVWSCSVAESEIDECFQSGNYAHSVGVDVDSNPCTWDSHRRAWMRGWLDAAEPEAE